MAEDTRLKVLNDSLRAVQEAQIQHKKEFEGLHSTVLGQQKLFQEVLHRLSSLGTQLDDFKANLGKTRPTASDLSSQVSRANNTPTLRHKPAPVEISRFSGSNPEAWTFQLVDWPYLAEILVKRFRENDFEAPEGRLAKLRQHTTVTEYQAGFEAISNETMALLTQFLLHCFISGLLLDIKTTVLVHRPTTLEDAITLAHLHEQCITLEKGFVRPSLGRSPPLLPPLSPPPSSVGSTPTSPTTLPGKQPVKRLSYAEAQQRRVKGLCFYCDENDSALAEGLQVQEVQSQSAISYHALTGSISPTTLRFTGHVHGTPVQVLVDGGSTHNFVQARVPYIFSVSRKRRTLVM
ncbi:hypothetical protein CRG98_042019 [Punica granatum]|uniref:Retrotransposon gag domain-containing protein n=1 Tax=Punica granatum TaxID=22663 RepID=A0A2I0I0V6_PUNGR|nr:hypothetical protein CRG98_042019 [Punica granatum]